MEGGNATHGGTGRKAFCRSSVAATRTMPWRNSVLPAEDLPRSGGQTILIDAGLGNEIRPLTRRQHPAPIRGIQHHHRRNPGQHGQHGFRVVDG